MPAASTDVDTIGPSESAAAGHKGLRACIGWNGLGGAAANLCRLDGRLGSIRDLAQAAEAARHRTEAQHRVRAASILLREKAAAATSIALGLAAMAAR